MKKSLCIVLSVTVLLAMSACGNKEDISKNDSEGFVTSIHTDYPVYDSAKEIVDAAGLVFSGTVKGISYEVLDVRSENNTDSQTGLSNSAGIPYTLYKIEIKKIYKGNVEGDTITIKRPGGQVDSNEYVLEDATDISEGETYLFLAEQYENTYPSLLNASQASYNLNGQDEFSTEGNDITLSQIMEVLEEK